MEKIKILMIPSDIYGVGHYRQIWAAKEIQNNHKDVYVDLKPNIPVTEDDVGKYDIVHFHRRINKPEETVEWINKLRDGGAIVVSDLDDYWVPFHGHPVRATAIANGAPQKIIEANRAADYVTTTTELFAKHIRKINPNVHVIPNAVDPNMKMWIPQEQETDRIRIAWIGGSSHLKDLKKMEGTFNKLLNDPEVKDKIQIVLCGYDIRGESIKIDSKTGKKTTRKIKPEESIWVQFEEIFSDYGRAKPEQYLRRTTLPITKYGEHYNFCDICLAPLAEHTFNEVKSELKIIEAGMMGKALIASDVYMYKELLAHGENAMLVDPRKDHKLWYRYIKKLVLDESLRKKLSSNLHEMVMDNYTLEKITKERVEWYKTILNR